MKPLSPFLLTLLRSQVRVRVSAQSEQSSLDVLLPSQAESIDRKQWGIYTPRAKAARVLSINGGLNSPG